MTKEWAPFNNGGGKRIWFLMRDAPTQDLRYHFGANGQLVRYASITTAQKAADKLNKHEAKQ